MRILIISEERNYIKIKSFLLSYMPFYDRKYNLSIEYYNNIKFKLEEFNRVIIDEYHLDYAAWLYKDTSDFSDLYIWFKSAIISVINPELLSQFLKEAMQIKEWNLMKQINKIKIEINRIMRKEILDTYPSQLQLESTSYCNAECIMCSHYYAGNNGAMDMSIGILEKLKELFPYLDLIIMHGNGEPFASRLFNESVKMYSSYNIGLTTNTNLSILNKNHIEKINQSFVNIRVSCDACTKEIYEGIRRNLSFENFVNNAARLRDLCPTVTKTMATVIMRQNIEQLPDLVRFAAEYGFDEIVFSNLGTSLIVGNENDSVSLYPYFAARQLNLVLETGKLLKIKVTIPSSFNLELVDIEKCNIELAKIRSKPFFYTENDILKVKELANYVMGTNLRIVEDLSECFWEENLFACEGICDWCIEKPYIDLNGDLFVCCINASYRIGNIFEYESFIDLWNNETYKKIRKLFYSGKLPGFCDNCQFIVNGSLSKLSVPIFGDGFFNRRHISKFYNEYCEEYNDER